MSQFTSDPTVYPGNTGGQEHLEFDIVDVESAHAEGFRSGFRSGIAAASRVLRSHAFDRYAAENPKLAWGVRPDSRSGEALALDAHADLIDAQPRDDDYVMHHENSLGYCTIAMEGKERWEAAAEARGEAERAAAGWY